MNFKLPEGYETGVQTAESILTYYLPTLTKDEAEFLQELLEDKMLEWEKVLSTDYEAGEQYKKLMKLLEKLDPYLPQEGYSK